MNKLSHMYKVKALGAMAVNETRPKALGDRPNSQTKQLLKTDLLTTKQRPFRASTRKGHWSDVQTTPSRAKTNTRTWFKGKPLKKLSLRAAGFLCIFAYKILWEIKIMKRRLPPRRFWPTSPLGTDRFKNPKSVSQNQTNREFFSILAPTDILEGLKIRKYHLW